MSNQPTSAIVKTTSAFSLQLPDFTEVSLGEDTEFRPSTKVQWVSAAALKQGVHLMGGPGSGKSRLLGRVFAWQALLKEEPLVVLDPTGAVIDNLLDKIVRLPLEIHRQFWPRLHYIDAGAEDYIVPTPLYYQQSQAETLFAIANRFPWVLRKQDPDLRSAPILGWNSLYECAIYAGQIAAALGRQLDFVMDLLDHPSAYKVQLREALAQRPELQPAVTYFRELMDPTSAKLRERRTGSFKNKLLPFLADPTMLATFAGRSKRLRWKRAVQQRKAVLIDLRHERDPDRRQFKMIWYLKTFTDYIKQRGMAGRGAEVMLILDEITDMLDQQTVAGQAILAGDLEELIARLGRNFGVNVIVAHQNLSQLDERIQNVLMQMGTQLIGVIQNPDDAVRVARQFLHYDPYWVKKTERVWHSVPEPAILAFFGGGGFSGLMPKVIDYKTVEFTPEEQLLLLVNQLQALGRFRFLSRVATGEGDLRGTVKKLSVERLDQNQYPNEQILAGLRQQLAQRDGVPIETLLAEIRAAQPREDKQKAPKVGKQSARLKDSSPPAYVPTDHLPVSAEPTTAPPPVAPPAKAAESSKDEPVFQ